MTRIFPRYSKSAVDRAGTALREDHLEAAQQEIVDNWRASHAVVLNTFRQTINRHTRGKSVLVAQRLKRLPTIADKLRRYPDMRLSRMQDIAGCRLIFPDTAALYAHRAAFHASRFKHELRNARDDYDYILQPKQSGYRGVHDIYRYQSFSGTAELTRWDGLQIEIQYRTQVQHAWATAVEVYDAIAGSRVKFAERADAAARYFRLASELLARRREGIAAALLDLSDWDLAAEMSKINIQTKIIHDLIHVAAAEIDLGAFGIKPFSFAVLLYDAETGASEALPVGRTMKDVTARYFEIERENKDKNVVLVYSQNSDDTRNAYRNYFQDVRVFNDLIISCSNEIIAEHDANVAELFIPPSASGHVG